MRMSLYLKDLLPALKDEQRIHIKCDFMECEAVVSRVSKVVNKPSMYGIALTSFVGISNDVMYFE